MPGGTAPGATHDGATTGQDASCILDLQVPDVSYQVPMHFRRSSQNYPLGTRGGSRSSAGTSGSQPGYDAHPSCHRGTPVRHLESVDGIDALHDQNAGSGEYRDESARAGVQHEANDEHYGPEIPHRGNRGIESPFLVTK